MKTTSKALLLASLCLLPTAASAQRMRDMSLSVEDTMKQPAVSHAKPGYGGVGGVGPGGSNDPYVGNNPAYNNQNDPYSSGARGNTFMAGYCDPNFHPVVNNRNLAALQSCMESQKQQSCADFERLPVDAQRAIDNVVGCLYVASDTGYDEQQPAATNDPGCTAGDSQRLQLVRKYWKDETTAHALVFMPEDILDASTNCMGRRR